MMRQPNTRQRGFLLITVVVVLAVLAAMALTLSSSSSLDNALLANQTENDTLDYVVESGMQHAMWQLLQNSACTGYADLPATAFGPHSYSASISPMAGSPVSLQSIGTLASGAQRVFRRDNVPVYDLSLPMAGILTLDVGGKDTFIEGDPGHTDHNKGSDAKLNTSSEVGKEYRTLLQFDLSGLPPSATVRTATLELEVENHGSTDVVEAHRLLRDWTEDGVTWNDYDGVSPWSTPGGDYDAAIAGSFLVDGTGAKTMDITELVRVWANGTQPNYGLLLLSPPAAGGGANIFYSSDQGGNPQPRLTVNYVCECGAPCPGIIIGQNVILSTEGNAVLGGLSFTDKDLAEYDRATDTATLFFEGAPLGLAQDIDALHVLANGHIVLSAINTINFGGITAENEDLIDYDPVADIATMLFDGSALFTSGSTDISAVHVMDNGHLLLTNEYSATLGGLSFQPKDLIEYNPGANTATMLLDGSAVGLSGSINAVHRLDNGNLVLSTNSTDTLGGLTFDRDDLVEYDLALDSATLYMDGTLFAGSENVRSVHIGPGSGGDSGGSSNLLLVVGDDGSLTNQEAARRTLIESWGYAVNVIDVDDSQSAFDAAVAANDVAYISDSIIEAALGTKLTSATIGIVNESIDLNVVLGFSGSSANSSRDEIDIIDNSHSITAGFALGLTTITNSLQRFTYFFTDTAPGQQVLAETNHLGPQYNTSFVTLETGADLWGGGTAAGRRVQLPWGDGTFDITALNADGLTMLQRALEWGAGADGASATGPIAHWKLDDGTGTTALDSEGGHDGTLINSPAWAFGKVNAALNFDGSNDYVDLTSDTELDDVFVGGATVMAWIYPTGWGENGYGRIFDKSSSASSTGDGWVIRMNTDNGGIINFGQGFSGDRGWWKIPNGSISLNAWQHIAVAYDAGDTANDPVIYLDGSPVSVTRVDSPSGTVRSDASINLRLGNFANGTAHTFDGKIDDARIYDRLLDASEISDIAGGNAGPIAHWKLDETSGDTAVDSVGGNDGTLVNEPSWATGKIDGGLSFDGDDDYIEIASLNPMSYDDFTVSAWYKSAENGVDDDEYIFEHNDNFSYEVTFGPSDDGTDDRLRFGFANGGSGYETWDPHYGTSDIVDQQWHHVVGIREAGRIKLYVDGVLETDGADAHAGSTITIDGDGPFIGDLPGNTERVHGTLDDVRLYDRALSATEVADLFALGSGGDGGGGGGDGCTGTFRDEFNTEESYAGSDGSEAWSTNWLEINENGDAGSGDERVVDEDSDFHLQVRDNDGGGEGVQREADLSEFTSATFSFEYRRDGFDNSNDYVMVHASGDGGASWTELDRFLGPGTDSSYVSRSYDISAHISSNSRIRFLTSPNLGSGDEMYIDNVEIAVSGCANP